MYKVQFVVLTRILRHGFHLMTTTNILFFASWVYVLPHKQLGQTIPVRLLNIISHYVPIDSSIFAKHFVFYDEAGM